MIGGVLRGRWPSWSAPSPSSGRSPVRRPRRAVAFGLLGMVLTRPQRGVRTLGELLLSAFIGLVGAVVVSGYDVDAAAVPLPHPRAQSRAGGRVGPGLAAGSRRRSIGRRGGIVIVFGGAWRWLASVAYAQAIRSWGSPGVLEGISDLDRWLSDTFGASPGRSRHWSDSRCWSGVWPFGAATARAGGCAPSVRWALPGVTSSLIQTTTLSESLASTGYSVLIGAVIGLVAIGLDRVLTGGGGRKADASAAARRQNGRSRPASTPLL